MNSEKCKSLPFYRGASETQNHRTRSQVPGFSQLQNDWAFSLLWSFWKRQSYSIFTYNLLLPPHHDHQKQGINYQYHKQEFMHPSCDKKP